ncbi:DUF1353 domain-containing protein [Hymenobacter sp. BT491]|uniref:DUF1353 domain-containing protein n=1 Tax=Hymenobacter sp. BT491 TaxID=2766779 RepID=UPI0016539064|nr:DUF1353 domain-containing protein [Hymenobacter sp. BT491]MBC6992242.1 DUF1353 domain-containing protein [Hymenobacter sp. BT491]
MPTLGTFSDDPQATWLVAPGLAGDPADRDMTLVRDFWFTDPAGTTWWAPAGSVVNGASIPAPLWSTVGSPYTGPYRRASIVHDVACDHARTAPDTRAARAAADHMFYQACLAGGCSPAQAELLYAGVRLGAVLDGLPFWNQPLRVALLATDRTLPDVPEESVRTTFRELAAAIQAAQPATFPQLAALVEAHLQAKVAQPLPAMAPPARQLRARPALP